MPFGGSPSGVTRSVLTAIVGQSGPEPMVKAAGDAEGSAGINVRNVLYPGDKPLGLAGSNKKIRIVRGQVADGEDLFAQLSAGGKFDAKSTPDKQLVRLSQGG